MSDKASFRQLILEAARKADLPFGQRVKLRIALRTKPDELAKEILEQAKAEGVIPQTCGLDDVASASVGDRDWASFFAAFASFIEKVLPLILQVLPILL